MKMRKGYSYRAWDMTAEEVLRTAVDQEVGHDHDRRLDRLVAVVGRLIDHVQGTDAQKMAIIGPVYDLELAGDDE